MGKLLMMSTLEWLFLVPWFADLLTINIGQQDGMLKYKRNKYTDKQVTFIGTFNVPIMIISMAQWNTVETQLYQHSNYWS